MKSSYCAIATIMSDIHNISFIIIDRDVNNAFISFLKHKLS